MKLVGTTKEVNVKHQETTDLHEPHIDKQKRPIQPHTASHRLTLDTKVATSSSC